MTKKGFTLIELLIVVTIIGILAVALVPRIVGGSASSRDARRQTDVQAIATGLEYYLSENGDFDDIDGGGKSTGNDLCSADGDLDDLVDFVGAIPSDPQDGNGNVAFLNGGCAGGYVVTLLDDSGDNLTKYAIAAHLEIAEANQDNVYTVATVQPNVANYAAISFTDYAGAGEAYYVVY